ncbi:hypothetical protein TNCT_238161 [Trichonephila clavata]|uniref:Uncharacterized protein n=1 Tax=Trichonephila clavata TaxID=2740835 RepID=A0A8X6L975_TRICU|nr:hypothetical protein TNCT_238161 [Trichonephila clavata]
MNGLEKTVEHKKTDNDGTDGAIEVCNTIIYICIAFLHSGFPVAAASIFCATVLGVRYRHSNCSVLVISFRHNEYAITSKDIKPSIRSFTVQFRLCFKCLQGTALRNKGGSKAICPHRQFYTLADHSGTARTR